MHKACLLGKCPKEKYHSYKGEVGKIIDNVINTDFSYHCAFAEMDYRGISV